MVIPQRYLIGALFVTGLLALALPARAQPTGQSQRDHSAGAGQSGRRAGPVYTVMTADVSGLKDAPLFVAQEGKPVQVDLRPRTRSSIFHAPPSGKPISFARAKKEGGGFEVVATVQWPSGPVTHALVYLLINADGSVIKPIVLDDSPSAFAVNTMKVFNTTSANLLVKADSFMGEVAAYTVTKSIPYPDLKDVPPGSFKKYPFGLALKGREAEPLYTANLEVAPGSRSLILILPPRAGGGDKPQVMPVIDRPIGMAGQDRPRGPAPGR